MKLLIGRMLLVLVILQAVLGASSCNNQKAEEVILTPPAEMNDGIHVGTPTDVNIDERYIKDAIQKIYAGKFGEIHSMLIYKNDKLVVEEYFPGHLYAWDKPYYHGDYVEYGLETMHSVMSVTKSFVSACIGIAIDKGFIKSVDQSIFDYLPEHQHLLTNNREYITIEHLLTMTSGLAWDEWSAAHGTESANDMDRLYFDCNDPVTCVLDREWWAEPGTFFTYNGGGIVILGEILRNATGLDLDEFSKKYLFAPLGIKEGTWMKYPNGVVVEAASSLSVTPRNMLKLGVTYLDNGMWNGERILSADWVAKSSTVYHNNVGIKLPIEDSGKNGYGYTWWQSELYHGGKNIKMYRANGWGGQVIMVFPELDMTVVFTSGNWAGKSKLFKLVRQYILPSIEMRGNYLPLWL
ncbi:serine hydrolase [Draconibacterium orientale]|uniref:serine hydrolase domain-containing protein n=1 Tax=Draconibacterium orientale TaxID=1168034 RepID=UPI002A0A8658|nr:serine hydrolase [Draconibacterium orientale]